MGAQGYGLSDLGRHRANNEDAFVIDAELGLFMVADGMGGQAAGEKASLLALAAARASIRAERQMGNLEEDAEDYTALRRAAVTAVRSACEAVFSAAESHTAWSGMGCTLTLVVLEGRKAAMAHVGDTRLYLYRDGSVWQLSSDHTLAAEMVRRGELTPTQGRDHRYASALTRAIGTQPSVEIETLVFDVLSDDVLLLCSDGLSAYVDRPGDLTSILGADDLDGAPARLVALANERGGRDNVTAVAIGIESDHANAQASDLDTWLSAALQLPGFQRERFANLLRCFHAGESRELEGGEVWVERGGEPIGLALVLEGQLEVQAEGGAARRLERGQAFGAASLLAPNASPATLRAAQPCRIFHLSRDAFRRLAMQRPLMGIRLLLGLAESSVDVP